MSACWWSLTTISATVREVNEPNPGKFDPNQIVSHLDRMGVKVKVEKVIYVNRDSTTYIFKGQVLNLDVANWKQVDPHLAYSDVGMMVIKQTATGSFVGYSSSSRPGNVSSTIETKWKELVK
jgi:hypothetical protein